LGEKKPLAVLAARLDSLGYVPEFGRFLYPVRLPLNEKTVGSVSHPPGRVFFINFRCPYMFNAYAITCGYFLYLSLPPFLNM